MAEPTEELHGYFLLQVRTRAAGGWEVSGVLEDLRTGCRFAFESLSDLNRLVHPKSVSGAWASARGAGSHSHCR